MQLNYNLLSKHRTKLMGFAILNILLLHFCQDAIVFNTKSKIIYRFSQIYGRFLSSFGVDLFIIVSAIGIYYSWNKSKNIKNYFMKRITRVLIPYFLISIPYFLVINFVINNNTFIYLLKDLFFISFFQSGNTIFWYIFAIMMFYILFPILNKIVNKKNGNLYITLLLVLDVIFNYLIYKYNIVEYNKIIILLVRVPAMLIGTIVAKKVYDKEPISKNTVSILFMLFFIVNMIFVYDFKYVIHDFFYSRYLILIVAIMLMFVVSLILEYIDNKRVNKVLEFFGKYTLELYLFHIAFRHIIVYERLFPLYRIKYAPIFVIAMTLISVLFSKAYSKVEFKKD